LELENVCQPFRGNNNRSSFVPFEEWNGEVLQSRKYFGCGYDIVRYHEKIRPCAHRKTLKEFKFIIKVRSLPIGTGIFDDKRSILLHTAIVNDG
jgi:hypothetical protein